MKTGDLELEDLIGAERGLEFKFLIPCVQASKYF